MDSHPDPDELDDAAFVEARARLLYARWIKRLRMQGAIAGIAVYGVIDLILDLIHRC